MFNVNRPEPFPLQSLAVFLPMLSLRAGDPILPLDPVGGGVELLRDHGDILRLPARNLDKGVQSHLVQGPRKDGTDPGNLTQVVFLSVFRRFRLFHL